MKRMRVLAVLLAALFVMGIYAGALAESAVSVADFDVTGDAIPLTRDLYDEITALVFLSSTADAPEAAREMDEGYEMEAVSGGPVLSWMQPRESGGYVAFVAGEGGIKTILTTLGFGTKNLEELYFNNSLDTSEVELIWFNGLTRLRVLDLSGVNTSGIDDMGGMFQGCMSLVELDLSGFDTSKVEDMSSMFAGCESLTSLNLSGFDTSKVMDMYSMFQGCGSLTELNLSSFDTSKVTNMYSMFSGCANLAALDLSGFHTSKVEDMSWMFNGCASLTALDLSGFDTSSVVDMRNMFENCAGLTEIHVNKDFDTDFEDMFEGCGTDRVTRK